MEEARWLTERTDLTERTASEGTIAYSWRGGHDRRCRRASGTVNAQNSGGVNELDHVRSRPGPPSRLYSLYRGLVFPMGPRLISWLCESDAARAREPIMPSATSRARISRAIFFSGGGGERERSLFALYDYIWRTKRGVTACAIAPRVPTHRIFATRDIIWLDIARVIIKHVRKREKERKRGREIGYIS